MSHGPFEPTAAQQAELAEALRRLNALEARLRAEYEARGEPYLEPSFEDLEPGLRQMMFDAGVVGSREQEDHVEAMIAGAVGKRLTYRPAAG